MKGKIIDHYWDEEIGYTEVEKQTKYGIFWGSTLTDSEEDGDVKNQWDGGMFAEYKCDLQAEKVKYTYMRERAKGIRHAYNVLARNHNPLDDVLLDLAWQATVAEREAQKQKEKCEHMRNSYPEFVDKTLQERRKFRKKIEENQE